MTSAARSSAYRRADAAGLVDGSFSLGEMLLARADYGRARNAFVTAQERGHPEAVHRLSALAQVSAPAVVDPGASLAFDGIYEHRAAESTQFLRFYPDERVIGVSSTPEATAEQIDAWFAWEHDAPAKGSFKLRDDEIIFETTSRWGTVRYSGRIVSPGLLVLDTHSLINGFRSEGVRFTLAER